MQWNSMKRVLPIFKPRLAFLELCAISHVVRENVVFVNHYREIHFLEANKSVLRLAAMLLSKYILSYWQFWSLMVVNYTMTLRLLPRSNNVAIHHLSVAYSLDVIRVHVSTREYIFTTIILLCWQVYIHPYTLRDNH